MSYSNNLLGTDDKLQQHSVLLILKFKTANIIFVKKKNIILILQLVTLNFLFKLVIID